MEIIALDIETAPDLEALDRVVETPPSFEAPKNYKDPEKIAAYLREAEAKWHEDLIKKASLSPLTGQVVCVALWDGKEGEVISLCKAKNEAALLQWVMASIDSADIVLTFNGYSFDAPFLRLRGLKHNIIPARCLDARRYSYHPLCDLRMYLTGWDPYTKGTLADWCGFFGVPCPGKDLGVTGADVAHLVEEGRWKELEEYNLGDTQAVWGLWKKLQPALLPLIGLPTQATRGASS